MQMTWWLLQTLIVMCLGWMEGQWPSAWTQHNCLSSVNLLLLHGAAVDARPNNIAVMEWMNGGFGPRPLLAVLLGKTRTNNLGVICSDILYKWLILTIPPGSHMDPNRRQSASSPTQDTKQIFYWMFCKWHSKNSCTGLNSEWTKE